MQEKSPCKFPQQIRMVADVGNCLLVDIGNQRLKWRIILSKPGAPESLPWKSLFDEGIIDLQPGFSDESISIGGGQAMLGALENSFSCQPAPEWILLSAVCQNEIGAIFTNWCRQHWQIVPKQVVPQKEFDGLINGYEDPAQLGCDRWLAAIAAYRLVCCERGQNAVVVVDAGTAVTVDLVECNQFVGGTIFPGINTMIRVLGQTTGQIKLNTSAPFHAVGTDTPEWLPSPLAINSDDAVIVGAWYAVCGGVEHCIRELKSHKKSLRSVSILITGGDARTVAAGIGLSSECRSNLVLDGLALVAKEHLS